MSQDWNAAKLIANAERATGLCDWGGAPYFATEFSALMNAMLHSLEHEAALHAQGARGAQARLAALLEARLGLINDRKRWPAIAAQRISQPLIILGLPRSGSTFLQTLLSHDPANRVPLTWEMALPSPLPEADAEDPRIARMNGILNAMQLQTPEILALHPFGACVPDEDHLMTEIVLLGDNLPALWRMPTYNRLRAAIHPSVALNTLKMVLQNLQFRHRCERIVLKNPGYVLRLPQLLSAFPDARLIQTHRDPAKVMPSVAALVGAMRRAASDTVAPIEKIARGNLDAFAAGVERAIAYREQAGLNRRIFDVHFRALIADPMGTVARLYAHFGLPLTDQAREAMQRWLDDPASRTPRGQHTLAGCGLDESMIDAAFGDYMAHYQVIRERTGA
jgi:Sulfotransferase family